MLVGRAGLPFWSAALVCRAGNGDVDDDDVDEDENEDQDEDELPQGPGPISGAAYYARQFSATSELTQVVNSTWYPLWTFGECANATVDVNASARSCQAL